MPLKSAVWKYIKDGKCQVNENEKICGEPVNKEHSGSVWRHFERFHKKFYDQLKAEEEEDYPVPKNVRCVAHTLQLCLKDVFEKNTAMKSMKT
jgi:hypothetical protein